MNQNETMKFMMKFQQQQQTMQYQQILRQMMMEGNYPKRQWDQELYARYNEIVRVGDAVINRHTKKIARVIRKDEVDAGAYFGGMTPKMVTVYVLQYPDNTIHRWGFSDMASSWSLCQPPAMEEAMLPEELR
tara:strand:- start:3411 stop:3806 length:396 start_codon:yes stop_codon:yes gene_type:complete